MTAGASCVAADTRRVAARMGNGAVGGTVDHHRWLPIWMTKLLRHATCFAPAIDSPRRPGPLERQDQQQAGEQSATHWVEVWPRLADAGLPQIKAKLGAMARTRGHARASGLPFGKPEESWRLRSHGWRSAALAAGGTNAWRNRVGSGGRLAAAGRAARVAAAREGAERCAPGRGA
jgi:hypothetical protein